MRTITGNIGAWLASHNTTANPEIVENLSFVNLDMADNGWVKVGEAEFTISLDDQKTIVAGQVAKLREEKRQISAIAEKRLTEIEGQIQSVLSIEYKPS